MQTLRPARWSVFSSLLISEEVSSYVQDPSSVLASQFLDLLHTNKISLSPSCGSSVQPLRSGSQSIPHWPPGPGLAPISKLRLQRSPALGDLCSINPTVLPLLWISNPLVSFLLSLDAIALHYNPFLENIFPCAVWAWQNTNPPTSSTSCTRDWTMLGGNWKRPIVLSWHLWPQVSYGPPTLLVNAA